MIENATIARPYAQAAFEQAQEEGALAQWSEMLETLSNIVSDAQMRSLIHNPKLSKERLSQLVLDICGSKFSRTGSNFVRILVDAGRLSIASKIFEMFEDERSDAEGAAEVYVITAYPLTVEQKAKITEVMARRLGKKVEVISEVDESLIGGAVMRSGDSVIDASISGRLQDLNNVLAN